jgi:hypothetical protein
MLGDPFFKKTLLELLTVKIQLRESDDKRRVITGIVSIK